MDKKFAIFDMDGTLVDSMFYWENLVDLFLTKRGCGPVPAQLQEEIKTMTVAQAAALFVQMFDLPETPEQLTAAMDQQMREYYEKDIPLKPGVHQYLEKLRAAGVQMCVASATSEPLVRLCLERLGIAPFFSFFLSCESVGVGKESPAVYHAAAQKWGASPEQVAVYEDALHAAQTAKQAGYYVVGVYDDNAKTEWPALTALADETIADYETLA